MAVSSRSLAEARSLLGEELGVSDWLVIDQETIDAQLVAREP